MVRFTLRGFGKSGQCRFSDDIFRAGFRILCGFHGMATAGSRDAFPSAELSNRIGRATQTLGKGDHRFHFHQADQFFRVDEYFSAYFADWRWRGSDRGWGNLEEFLRFTFWGETSVTPLNQRSIAVGQNLGGGMNPK